MNRVVLLMCLMMLLVSPLLAVPTVTVTAEESVVWGNHVTKLTAYVRNGSTGIPGAVLTWTSSLGGFAGTPTPADNSGKIIHFWRAGMESSTANIYATYRVNGVNYTGTTTVRQTQGSVRGTKQIGGHITLELDCLNLNGWTLMINDETFHNPSPPSGNLVEDVDIFAKVEGRQEMIHAYFELSGNITLTWVGNTNNTVNPPPSQLYVEIGATTVRDANSGVWIRFPDTSGQLMSYGSTDPYRMGSGYTDCIQDVTPPNLGDIYYSGTKGEDVYYVQGKTPFAVTSKSWAVSSHGAVYADIRLAPKGMGISWARAAITHWGWAL